MMTNLRRAIITANRSQRSLALALHIPPSRVSEYATGHRAIPEHHAEKLGAALGVPASEILGWAGETANAGALDALPIGAP